MEGTKDSEVLSCDIRQSTLAKVDVAMAFGARGVALLTLDLSGTTMDDDVIIETALQQ